jgi:Ca2+/H+ antiporter, TMEM165/GDT1 family
MLPTRRHRAAKLVFFVLPLFLVLFALFVWAVQSLWNGLLPDIFGVKAITYWQALGVMVLSWILFGGFRGGRSRGRHWRDYGMRRRWQRMTPAEREEFLQGLRARWSAGPETSPPPPAPGDPRT